MYDIHLDQPKSLKIKGGLKTQCFCGKPGVFAVLLSAYLTKVWRKDFIFIPVYDVSQTIQNLAPKPIKPINIH